MKIFKFFPFACAALMMSACSSDNDIEGGATKPGSDPQYLAVNIVNVGTTPTRAGEYENGTEEESKIKKVRFYFFNGDGSPYLIKNPNVTGVTGGGNVNYLEATPGDDTTTPGTSTSVEKITQTVLIINGVQNAAPAAIMAVVNPETVEPATLKDGATMRLSELRSTAVGSKFYNKDVSTGKVSDFVMSNSVYINAGEDVCSSLVAGHLTTSEKTAMENPVDLYVERVVAKVTADVDKDAFKVGDGSNWETTKYGTTTPVGKYGDYDVYAVIEGWGLAEENGKAEVEKQVDKSWTDGTLGIGTWNTYDYHRSFWERSVAFNTGVDGNRPVNHKYEEFKAKMKDELYTLPNTPIDKVTNLNTNNLTKLLVAATLRYKDAENNWHNAEICRYNGMNFLGIDNLKKHVASTFSQYYTSTDNTHYTQLSGSDIDFKDPDATMVQYRVTPTLAADPEGVTKKYYTKNPGTTSDFTEVNKSTVLAAIEASKAEVRKDGKAYYFVPIKHLGKAGELGEYGVVRNHFYKITLTGIKGFGTPVYNPELVIDPTVPTYDNTYLAARVQVLQWRVVNQNVSLGE
ncbi:hypothetical protein CIK90_09985 [Prevotella sp. P5-126]|uniref:Mfa1 family fimbria major subunit n=1 Tax=Prevotella sp. P5-126 TaxID=2024216 RepID=UPI000B95F15C|nr:Mfa1 family fimbria major subunit [Prevotella sp. P5-126]OYP36493.1 hypothetical protein CIK90_09985 [Prevotella sp. P5-126]